MQSDIDRLLAILSKFLEKKRKRIERKKEANELRFQEERDWSIQALKKEEILVECYGNGFNKHFRWVSN